MCPLFSLEGRIAANQLKRCCLLSHSTDLSGLPQCINASTHREKEVAEWFDKYENNVTHNHLPAEHLLEHSPPPSSEIHMIENLLEDSKI